MDSYLASRNRPSDLDWKLETTGACVPLLRRTMPVRALALPKHGASASHLILYHLNLHLDVILLLLLESIVHGPFSQERQQYHIGDKPA